MKASELYRQALTTSQKALASEDEYAVQSFAGVIDFSSIPDYESIVKLMNLNNEYIRMSAIKTVVAILIQNGVVENDLTKDSIDKIFDDFLGKP